MLRRSMNMMAKSGAAPASLFVGAYAAVAPSTNFGVSWPAGSQVGDLVFIFVSTGDASTNISGGAGGWTRSDITWTNYGYGSCVFHKVLASGDMAGVSLVNITSWGNGAAYLVSTYRGVANASLKSINPGATGTTLGLSGFAKSGSCKGLVTFASDRDKGIGVPPAGFTNRASGEGNYWSVCAADLVAPANYNGTDLTWSGFYSGQDQVGVLYELT